MACRRVATSTVLFPAAGARGAASGGRGGCWRCGRQGRRSLIVTAQREYQTDPRLLPALRSPPPGAPPRAPPPPPTHPARHLIKERRTAAATQPSPCPALAQPGPACSSSNTARPCSGSDPRRSRQHTHNTATGLKSSLAVQPQNLSGFDTP